MEIGAVWVRVQRSEGVRKQGRSPTWCFSITSCSGGLHVCNRMGATVLSRFSKGAGEDAFEAEDGVESRAATERS